MHTLSLLERKLSTSLFERGQPTRLLRQGACFTTCGGANDIPINPSFHRTCARSRAGPVNSDVRPRNNGSFQSYAENMDQRYRIPAAALIGLGTGYLAGVTVALFTLSDPHEALLQALCAGLAGSIAIASLETLPKSWRWKRSALAAALAPVCYAAFASVLIDKPIDLTDTAAKSFSYALVTWLFAHRFLASTLSVLVYYVARILSRLTS